MNAIAQAIETIRDAVSLSVAPQALPDLCTISSSASANDDTGGAGDTLTPVATSIPCSYDALSPSQLQIANRVIVGLSHQIKLPANAITQAIKPSYQIVIAARGNTPALTFQNPVVLDDSYSPFVTVAATLAEI